MLKPTYYILFLIFILLSSSCDKKNDLNYDKHIVILKADDIGELNENWNKYIQIIIDEKICSGIGLISDNVKTENAIFELKRIVTFKQSNGFNTIEFWNHGFNHYSKRYTKEFYGTTLVSQIEHLNLSQQFFISTFNTPCYTFGAPYNKTSKNTETALLNHPEIKVWLKYENTEKNKNSKWIDPQKSKIEKNDSKICLNINYIFLKYFNTREIIKNFKKDKNKAYTLIQIHPAYWNEKDFSEFIQLIQFYKTESKVVFMTPYQYYQYLHGNSFND